MKYGTLIGDMDISLDRLDIDTIATEVMGVPSSYSETNVELYQKSKDFFTNLKNGESSEELNKDLEEISDPAVRAFLEFPENIKRKMRPLGQRRYTHR